MDQEVRAAKRAAYEPIHDQEQHACRKLALSRSTPRGSAATSVAAAAAASAGGSGGGGGGTGSGGGNVDVSRNGNGNGNGGDSELEEANRGLPTGWKAQRSKSEAGRIYWFQEGRLNSSKWSRPGADAGVRPGGAGGG